MAKAIAKMVNSTNETDLTDDETIDEGAGKVIGEDGDEDVGLGIVDDDEVGDLVGAVGEGVGVGSRVTATHLVTLLQLVMSLLITLLAQKKKKVE